MKRLILLGVLICAGTSATTVPAATQVKVTSPQNNNNVVHTGPIGKKAAELLAVGQQILCGDLIPRYSTYMTLPSDDSHPLRIHMVKRTDAEVDIYIMPFAAILTKNADNITLEFEIGGLIFKSTFNRKYLEGPIWGISDKFEGKIQYISDVRGLVPVRDFPYILDLMLNNKVIDINAKYVQARSQNDVARYEYELKKQGGDIICKIEIPVGGFDEKPFLNLNDPINSGFMGLLEAAKNLDKSRDRSQTPPQTSAERRTEIGKKLVEIFESMAKLVEHRFKQISGQRCKTLLEK